MKRRIPRSKNLLLLLPFFALVGRAQADTLFIESSDQHAAYDRLPAFVQNVNQMAADFKRRDPSGNIVILINGDYTGLSTWSRKDRGWLAYDVLRELARKYSVIFVPGNHDGLDWGKNGGGNQLFADQLASLKKAGVPVLAANIVPGDHGQPIFTSHTDLTVANGQKTRVVGLALQGLLGQSNYEDQGAIRPIAGQSPTLEAIQKELTTAKADGIQKIVFAFHESTAKTQEILAQALPQAQKLGLQVPVAFSAHDHIAAHVQLGEVPLVNGGSDFAFAAVEVPDQGAVTKVRLFKSEAPTQAIPPTSPALQAIQDYTASIQREESQVIMTVPGFAETRADFVKGRTALGTRLSDTLADWGRSLRAKAGIPEKTPVLGFYNSTAYRGNAPIPAGNLTRGELRALYPFENESHLVQATGRELQATYRALRNYTHQNLGIYSPQLSSNLREAPPRAPGEVGPLEVRGPQGQWQALDPDASYAIVMDAWLSQNGFRIPEMDWVTDPKRIAAHELQQDILLHFAGGQISANAACANLLKDAASP